MVARSISTIDRIPRKNVASKPVRIVSPATPPMREIALVIVLAVVAMSALFIRMPYIGLVPNAIFTTLGLAGFFGYMKFRLGIQPPLLAIICPAIAVALDVIGNRFGLFSLKFGILPYDVIAHFAGSGLCLMAIMWLILAIFKRFDYKMPFGMAAFFSVVTTFSLASFYEITELWDEQLFGGHRIWSTHDTSHDLMSDLAGAILMAIVYSIVKTFAARKANEREAAGSRSRK